MSSNHHLLSRPDVMLRPPRNTTSYIATPVVKLEGDGEYSRIGHLDKSLPPVVPANHIAPDHLAAQTSPKPPRKLNNRGIAPSRADREIGAQSNPSQTYTGDYATANGTNNGGGRGGRSREKGDGVYGRGKSKSGKRRTIEDEGSDDEYHPSKAERRGKGGREEGT